MNTSTEQVLKFLTVIAWILFLVMCVTAGGILFAIGYVIFINPINAHTFWPGVDLSELYAYDQGYFYLETALMAIVGLLQAFMFYLIVMFLSYKKLNLAKPFSKGSADFIFHLCYTTTLIGGFSIWGEQFSAWLQKQNVSMPPLQDMRLEGGDIWIFMAITLFVIAHIFKRGNEIQEENDLTV